MNEQIDREKDVHGTRWNTIHEGYFADPAVAAPLVRKILEMVRISNPDTIADLGGGTGFLLKCLASAGIDPGVSLIDIDDSPVQIEAARSAGYSSFQGAVDSFSRKDIVSDEGRCLFIMRSVLHYFGKEGLRTVLKHLRAQAKPGEFFVHQTASFGRAQDADALNELYGLMKSMKWYPTVEFLRGSLRDEGWEVVEVCEAPTLRLTENDLMQRYHLGPVETRQIRDRLSRKPNVSKEIFAIKEEGFSAFLHYWIYVCTAV